MANDRLSQQPVEVVVSPTDGEARTSQQAVESVILPTTAKARASSQSVEAVISPTTAKARASQIVVEAVVENLSTQTVDVALITQTAATFTPTITAGAVNISLALIDQTAVALTPGIIIDQEVFLDLLDRTAAAHAPTLSSTYGVALDFLDQTATAHAPTVSVSLGLGLIDQTATTFALVLLIGPQWTTPGDGDPMTLSPELLFIIPSMSGDMHFEIQLDTAATFDTVDLRSVQSGLSQVGWSFWDGNSWEPVPSTGVDPGFAGNEARYAVQVPLTETTWHRRVRAGVVV